MDVNYQKEELNELITNSSSDSIYSYDRHGRFTSANRNLCETLQMKPNQIIGRTHRELGFPAELCSEWEDLHRQVYDSGQTVVTKTTAPVADGSIHYYEVTLNPMRNRSGEIIGICGNTRDITGSIKSQEALMASQGRLQSFLQISQAVTSVFEQKQIMQMIVDNATSVLELGSGAVYLLSNNQTIQLAATFPALPSDFPEEYRIATVSKHPHIKRVIDTRRYQVMPDSAKTELTQAEQEVVKLRNLRSNLYLPIALRDKIIGVLILSSVGEEYDFAKDEIELLQGFAHQAAHIIDNIRNYEELKHYSVKLEQHMLERKRAEQERLESEKSYRDIFDSSNDALLIHDTNTGEIVEVNRRMLSVFGYDSSEEVLNRTIADISAVDEGYNDAKANEAIKLASDNENHSFEWRAKKKSGELFWAQITLSKIQVRGVDRILAAVRDITERKLAEDKLTQERILLRTIIDSIPDAIYVKDTECRKVLSNIADCQNIGVSKEEDVIGKSDFEVFPPHIARRFFDKDQRVLRGERIVNSEEELVKPDGKRIWLLTTKLPLSNQDGDIIGVVGIGHNITERKQTEIQLRKLSQAVEQSPASVVITNLDGVIEYINPKFTQVTGYTSNEAIGQKPSLLKSGKQSGALYRELWETITAGKEWRGEIQNRRKDRTLFWETVLISPIFSVLGKPTHFIAVKEDITEQKRAQQELIEAKERAESGEEALQQMYFELQSSEEETRAANEELRATTDALRQSNENLQKAKQEAEASVRLKTAFLQNMSHEIRTPMNAIYGFSGLLKDPVLSDDKRNEFIDVIINSSNQLLAIISDILTISSIDTGQEELNNSKVCINDLIAETEAVFNRQIESMLVTLKSVRMLPDTDSEVIIDRTKLTQILTNLISNAIKFTSIGEIELGYTIESAHLQFYVKDNGIGIDRAKQRVIFDRFVQADDVIRTDYGGTGLGLSICKGFVELMGGRIWVESEVGKGATFYFTVPYNPVNTVKQRDVIPESTALVSGKVRVLVAEDQEYSFLLLEQYLKNYASRVIHARNGKEAVDICRECDSIDIVLMDIRMPVMDGVEAAKQIKSFRPNLPIVAQSAYALEQDIESAKGVFDDYITKPVDVETLLSVIRKLVV